MEPREAVGPSSRPSHADRSSQRAATWQDQLPASPLFRHAAGRNAAALFPATAWPRPRVGARRKPGRRANAALLSLLLGCTAVFASYAGLERIEVGPTAESAPVAEEVIAKREASLNRMEAGLLGALAQQPPALPPIPKFPPVKIPKPPPAPAIQYVYLSVAVTRYKDEKKHEDKKHEDKKHEDKKHEDKKKDDDH